MNNPLVSIIILNFNGINNTIDCLKSLALTNYKNVEILVVDNGSDTNESVILKKKFGKYKNYKFYRLKSNRGFTGGNNWAIKKSKGKYVVLLNNDTKVDPNWLNPLLGLMEKDSKLAVIQPKLLQLRDKNYFDYAGAAGGFIDKYGYPFTRGRIFNTLEKDVGQYDNITDIFWASGAACIIRRSIIKKVGGLFSEDLFNYMEEIDFCWRIWKAGYKVKFNPYSVVYHKGAESSKGNNVKKRYWEHRNNLYILIKNIDSKNLIKVFPIRLVFELATYAYYILSRQEYFIKSLSKAHLELFSNALTARVKKPREAGSKNNLIYPRSIIIDHFILNRKYFHNLNWNPHGYTTYVVINHKDSGGLRVIKNHIKGLKEKNYKAELFSILGRNKTNVISKIRKLFKYFFYPKPRNLIATFWPTAYLVLLLPAKNKYYLIQANELHFYENPLVKLLVKFTYKLPFKKLAVSDYVKRSIKDNNAIKITNPIETKHIENNQNFKNNVNTKTEVINILTVMTRYIYPKGPDIYRSVLKHIKKRNIGNLNFILVSMENKPISGNVDLFYSNPPSEVLVNLYRKSDILLCTSRVEGFFLPGIEAMANGCIVISTKNKGVEEYAINNKNSILVDSIDELIQPNFFHNILKKGKNVSKLINNGYATASKYSIKNTINELENIYY